MSKCGFDLRCESRNKRSLYSCTGSDPLSEDQIQCRYKLCQVLVYLRFTIRDKGFVKALGIKPDAVGSNEINCALDVPSREVLPDGTTPLVATEARPRDNTAR